VPAFALERLAEADAFQCMGLDRRRALWQVRALAASDLPLFSQGEDIIEKPTPIAAMAAGGEVVEDYRSVGLSLRRHPVSFLRDELRAKNILATADLAGARDGQTVQVAGIVLVRQRPGTASGVTFITIEDETGHANLIVWSALFERQRRLILSASMVSVRGRLQREGLVTHVVAGELTDLSDLLRSVWNRGRLGMPHGRGDEARSIRVATRDFR
jgi:error-prone DNA polymerase